MKSTATTTHQQFIINRLQALWNACIPKCAKCIPHVGGHHVRYLHPTKGWRMVSYKRLGLA